MRVLFRCGVVLGLAAQAVSAAVDERKVQKPAFTKAEASLEGPPSANRSGNAGRTAREPGRFRSCSAPWREVVEHYGDRIDAHPVGTDPFRLKSWRRSSEIVLERYPGYCRPLFWQDRWPWVDIDLAQKPAP
jgi:ABC-type transport system substrate-binding protein